MNSFQTFSFSYELSDSSTEDCMSDDDHFEDFPLPSFNTSNDDFPTPKSYHRNSSPTLYTPHTQSPPSIEIARRDLSPFCTESATFSPISPFTTSQKPIPILPLPTPEDNLLRTPVKEKEEKHVTILVPTPDFSNLKESNFADRKLTRTSSSNGIMPETPKKRGCQRSRLSHTPVTPARAPIHSPVHFSHKLTPKVNDNEVNKHLELHFDQLEKIGAGSFSNVFKARCIDDNTWYAIKILKRPLSSDSQRVKLIQELKIVKQMDHPHVLNYIFCWEQNQIPHFQMEMCSGGSLSHYMTSWQKMNRGRYFEESLLWKFLTDIALGLYHIHSHGIIHHDLKPGNIFVDAEGNLKIGDFGLADFESSSADTAEGDSRYLAPEVLDDIVSKAADIFSFGASIFELACLIEMPSADEPWNVLRSGNVSALPKFPTYSKEFKNLVDSMMHPQYDVRPTIEDILSYPNVLANIECRKLTKGNEYMNKIFMSKPITPSLPLSEMQPISQRDFTCTTQRKARYKRNLMNDLVGL